LVTAPKAQLTQNGFSNATALSAAFSGATTASPADSSNGYPSWLDWAPKSLPLYVFLAIVIGGLILLVLAICCIWIQCKRRRSFQFDSESGSQHLAKQYAEWNEGDEIPTTTSNNKTKTTSKISPDRPKEVDDDEQELISRPQLQQQSQPTKATAVEKKKLPARKQATSVTHV
jgi:cytoskeletal protein RodZ